MGCNSVFCLSAVDGFVEALQADQHQAQAVPGPVELRVEREGAAKCGFGLLEAAGFLEQEARLNQSAALRSGCDDTSACWSAMASSRRPACARTWERLDKRVGIVGPAPQHLVEHRQHARTYGGSHQHE